MHGKIPGISDSHSVTHRNSNTMEADWKRALTLCRFGTGTLVWFIMVMVTIPAIMGQIRSTDYKRSDSLSWQQQQLHSGSRPSSEGQRIQKYVYLPLDYDRGESPHNVTIYFRIHIWQILEVDEKAGILTLDVVSRKFWIDNRVRIDKFAPHPPSHLRIPNEHRKDLWTPNIRFWETKSLSYPTSEETDVVMFLDLLPDLFEFQLQERVTIQLHCAFDFHHYPADTQNCYFRISEHEDLTLWWSSGHLSPNLAFYCIRCLNYKMDGQDSNYEYSLEEIDYSKDYGKSVKGFRLSFRRKIIYHLLQSYFLSTLFVLVTWLCYFISVDMLELRIGVTASTLLSVVTLFASVKEDAPKVSYIKALDIWMVVNVTFIFLSLAAFACTAWLRKSLKRLHNTKETNHCSDFELENLLGPKIVKHDPIALTKTYLRWARLLEKGGFYLLAVCYCGFFLGYWVWLLWTSEYLSANL